MKKSDIPYYEDPTSFEDGNNKFPCDTQYMVYEPMLHRYFLTADGLEKYHIDAERKYITDSPDKVNELIQLTSKKVYDYILYKSGMRSYHVQMFRIAKSPKYIYPDQYEMRKQFEEALAYQARWLCSSGDTARYSSVSMEDKRTANTTKPEDSYRDTSDIAPETIRILETLRLTRWFLISQYEKLNLDEY